MNKEDKLAHLNAELSLREELTLDEYISWLQEVSDIGYGDTVVLSSPVGSPPYLYYDVQTNSLEI
jgi:hypothetical protein